MNAKLKKTFLTACLASSTMLAMATNTNDNPLMHPSTLPFGAPDFNKIKYEHYLPALQAGIAQQRAAVKRIVENKAKPTFANTILAYE